MKRFFAAIVAACLCLAALPAMAQKQIVVFPANVSDVTLDYGDSLQVYGRRSNEHMLFIPVSDSLTCAGHYNSAGQIDWYAFGTGGVMGERFKPLLTYAADGTLLEDSSKGKLNAEDCPPVGVGEKNNPDTPTQDAATVPKSLYDILPLPMLAMPSVTLDRADSQWTLTVTPIDGAVIEQAILWYEATDSSEGHTGFFRYDTSSGTLIWDNAAELAQYQTLEKEGKLGASSAITIIYEELLGTYAFEASLSVYYEPGSDNVNLMYRDGPVTVERSGWSTVWTVTLRETPTDDNTPWRAYYNADGRLTIIDQYDANGSPTRMDSYDEDGHVTQTCRYNADGQMEAEYDADGSLTKTFQYDEQGNWTGTYDADGNLIEAPEAAPSTND